MSFLNSCHKTFWRHSFYMLRKQVIIMIKDSSSQRKLQEGRDKFSLRSNFQIVMLQSEVRLLSL